MPIFIRDSVIDSRLKRLAESQSMRVTKHAIAEAIIERGLDHCDQKGPEAWRTIGDAAPASSTSAAKNTTGRSVGSVSNQPSTSASVQFKPASRAISAARQGRPASIARKRVA